MPNLLFGAGNFDKIWSECGQREIQYKERKMNKYTYNCPSQWPYGLRRLDCWYCGFESRWRHECSAVVCLVGSSLCDELITRSEKSYRVRVSVSVWELQISTMRQPSPELGCWATKKNIYIYIFFLLYFFVSPKMYEKCNSEPRLGCCSFSILLQN